MAPRPADAYDFPIRPGSDAWKQFTTGQAMVDACQLPADKLQSISTAGLLYTCLDYPLLSNMRAALTLQLGTRFVLTSFNGFAALRQRPEAAELLLAHYQKMRPACLPEPGIQRGAYSFSFSYVEMILAQDEYLAQLNTAQRQALLHEALAKYTEKKPLAADVYGGFGLKTTAFLLARVMLAESYPPFATAVQGNAALRVFVTGEEEQVQTQTVELVVRYAEQIK